MLTTVLGQSDGCCVSHCGPFHPSVDVDCAVASMPREMRSAGLELVGTCLHVAAAVFSCIRATLLPTKFF